MQTWKSTDIPEKWGANIRSLVRYHQIDVKNLTINGERIDDRDRKDEGEEVGCKLEYTLLTDEDCRSFVEEYFPKYLNMYDEFEYPIQRADFIRPLWLYIHGGIYMDLDYEVLKPFDSLFDQEAKLYLIKSNNSRKSLTNSFMASQPKCEFWLELAEEIYRRHHEGIEIWAFGKHLKVMMSTGPGVLTEVIKETKTPYMVLPAKLVNNISVKDFKNMPSKDEVDYYIYNLEGCSWGSWDTQLYNWCFQNYIWIIIIVVFIIIFLFLTWFIKDGYLNSRSKGKASVGKTPYDSGRFSKGRKR